MMKKGSLKDGVAGSAPATQGVTGVANATKAAPNTATTTQENAGLQEVVSKGLKPIRIGATEVAQPMKLRKGAADERDSNTDITTAGGSKGRVAIGETAVATPRRLG